MQAIELRCDTAFLFRSLQGNILNTEYNVKTALPRLKTLGRGQTSSFCVGHGKTANEWIVSYASD